MEELVHLYLNSRVMVKASIMVKFVKEYRAVLATFTSFVALFVMFMTFSSGKVDRTEFDAYKDEHERRQMERHADIKEDLKDLKESDRDIKEKLDIIISEK